MQGPYSTNNPAFSTKEMPRQKKEKKKNVEEEEFTD